jgi:hypothetical protein
MQENFSFNDFLFVIVIHTMAVCFNFYFSGLAKAQPEVDIEKYFIQLKEDINREFPLEKWQFSSQSPPYWELRSYKQLELISPNVLMPIMVDKSYSSDFLNFSSRNTLEWALASITCSVCKLDGWPHSDPWCGEPLLTRWYGGYEFSEEHFNLVYNLLLQLRKVKDEKKIEMINEALRSQGIFMLTFLMEKIIDGDDLLLPVVQKMFDKYGNEIKGKSKEEILAWWQQNKIKYYLPPQDKKKFSYIPSQFINSPKEHKMEEKINLLYHGNYNWEGRYIVQGTAPSQVQSSRKFIELGQLIGVENTPQFRFLVDLGKEALPYLFLKLRDEKERFTLPVIERIAGRKLSPEEIESCIKESEKLVGKPKQPAENQEIKNNNSHPQKEQPKIDQPKKEQPQNNKPNTTDVEPKTNTTASADETASEVKTVVWANLYYRPWESKDGIFRTHARFVALVNGKVILERFKDENTGKTISVDTKILRQVDIDTIEAIRKRYRELKAEGKPLPKGMIFDPI